MHLPASEVFASIGAVALCGSGQRPFSVASFDAAVPMPGLMPRLLLALRRPCCVGGAFVAAWAHEPRAA